MLKRQRRLDPWATPMLNVRPADVTGPAQLVSDLALMTASYRDLNGIDASTMRFPVSMIERGYVKVRPGSTWPDGASGPTGDPRMRIAYRRRQLARKRRR